MVDLSELTVVIISYQRQDFLARNMLYWSGMLPTVIVVDGTERPIMSKVLEQMASNIHYYWMHTKYEDRLRSVIPLIKTKYVVQLSDDEYFLPTGLQRCMDVLESERDVIACVGRCMNFWPTKKGTTVSHRYMNWPSILQDSAQERMEAKMFNLGALTIYGVMRRDPWINCIRLITEKAFSCCYVTEHLFELFSAYQGKSRVIDVLSWFRSGENHPKSFKGWNRDYHFEHWYRKQQNADEINTMFDILRKNVLLVTPEADPVLLDQGLRKAIEIFVRQAEAGKTRMSKIKAPFRKFAELIAANLPKSIKYPLKDILGLTRDHFDFNQLPERLAKVGIACHVDDLNQVVNSLRRFY